MKHKSIISAFSVLYALSGCGKEKVKETTPEPTITELEEIVISSNTPQPKHNLFDLIKEHQLETKTTGNFFQFAVPQTRKIALNNGYLPPTIANHAATQDARPWLYNSLRPFLINPPELLEGKIYRESSGDLNEGCNKQGACGPSQVTFSGMCTALSLLYSDTSNSKRFRDRDSSRLAKMRETRLIIDIFTSGYFSTLDQIISAINDKRSYNNKWIPVLNKDETAPGGENYETLASENKKLRMTRDMIREGYLVSNNTAKEAHNQYKAELERIGGMVLLNKVVNSDIPAPEPFLSQQEQMIWQMWELTKTAPYLNILLGDIALAYEIDYYVDTHSKNSIREGLMAYNQGRYVYEERKEMVRILGAKRKLTPAEKKELEIAKRLIGRSDGYQLGISATRRSNVSINEALYGDGQLTCNFTNGTMTCSDPKATLKYINGRKK
jgi:hypothetical protein